LGNLVCTIESTLNNVVGLVGLLNQLLGVVTGLVGGLTGALGGVTGGSASDFVPRKPDAGRGRLPIYAGRASLR